MKAHEGVYLISTMCKVGEVESSSYYTWRNRLPSVQEQANQALTEEIRRVHRKNEIGCLDF
jgi:hypothetical protein